jgi:hypothetical protein
MGRGVVSQKWKKLDTHPSVSQVKISRMYQVIISQDHWFSTSYKLHLIICPFMLCTRSHGLSTRIHLAFDKVNMGVGGAFCYLFIARDFMIFQREVID